MFDENSEIDKKDEIGNGLTELAMKYKGPIDNTSLYNARNRL